MSSSQISDIWVLLLITHNIILQWVVPKKIHTPPTEEISAVWGGGEGNCLKNVLNFYRLSGEGQRGIVNFLRGGIDLF